MSTRNWLTQLRKATHWRIAAIALALASLSLTACGQFAPLDPSEIDLVDTATPLPSDLRVTRLQKTDTSDGKMQTASFQVAIEVTDGSHRLSFQAPFNAGDVGVDYKRTGDAEYTAQVACESSACEVFVVILERQDQRQGYYQKALLYRELNGKIEAVRVAPGSSYQDVFSALTDLKEEWYRGSLPP